MRAIWKTAFLLTVVVASFSSCNDDENGAGNSYVNSWIYENMEFWYYWNTELPTNPNRSLEPPDFFESLLSSQDRFSWIQDDFQELLNSLQGITKEAGYEFKLYQKSGTNDLFMQVMYIKPNSPAENAGLMRGDIIEKVNGTQIDINNYQSLLGKLNENHSINHKRYNGDEFVDLGTFLLTTVEYAENPNFFHSIFEIEGKKIGYYVYTFFANGPSESSNQYNNEMIEVFSDFQTAGITELIIDLRFNRGGSETATINLASLIAKDVTSSTIFAKREYNDLVEDAILNDPQFGSEFLLSRFEDLPENIGSQLTRVYILTSANTASASELLINGLRPFMEVKLIGNTTYGKNYGSITITDEDNPSNKWGMQPIVVKSYNSLDQSDYDNGFTPDILDEDNDLVLYPLGDVNERLLNLALEDIVGGTVGGRKATSDVAGTSAEFKSPTSRRSNYLEGNDQRKRLNKLIDTLVHNH
jgi:C-terminal processing protease CtpA/Prc